MGCIDSSCNVRPGGSTCVNLWATCYMVHQRDGMLSSSMSICLCCHYTVHRHNLFMGFFLQIHQGSAPTLLQYLMCGPTRAPRAGQVSVVYCTACYLLQMCVRMRMLCMDMCSQSWSTLDAAVHGCVRGVYICPTALNSLLISSQMEQSMRNVRCNPVHVQLLCHHQVSVLPSNNWLRHMTVLQSEQQHFCWAEEDRAGLVDQDARMLLMQAPTLTTDLAFWRMLLMNVGSNMMYLKLIIRTQARGALVWGGLLQASNPMRRWTC